MEELLLLAASSCQPLLGHSVNIKIQWITIYEHALYLKLCCLLKNNVIYNVWKKKCFCFASKQLPSWFQLPTSLFFGKGVQLNRAWIITVKDHNAFECSLALHQNSGLLKNYYFLLHFQLTKLDLFTDIR